MSTVPNAVMDVEYEQPQQDAMHNAGVCATRHAWARHLSGFTPGFSCEPPRATQSAHCASSI